MGKRSARWYDIPQTPQRGTRLTNETKEPESGAGPFTQLKGSYLRIVLIFHMWRYAFDRRISIGTNRGIFEMDLPTQVSLTSPNVKDLRSALRLSFTALVMVKMFGRVAMCAVPRIARGPILIHGWVHGVAVRWVVRVRVLILPSRHRIHTRRQGVRASLRLVLPVHVLSMHVIHARLRREVARTMDLRLYEVIGILRAGLTRRNSVDRSDRNRSTSGSLRFQVSMNEDRDRGWRLDGWWDWSRRFGGRCRLSLPLPRDLLGGA